ncbi:MAG: hypothetical protein AAGD47_01885 [Pseudomonadota bacterium]
MGTLISGKLPNLQADTLAGRMDEEFVALFEATKGMNLPTDPTSVEDRRIMFVAIARGILRYLSDKSGRIDVTEDSAGSILNSEHDHDLDFTWSEEEP